MKISRLGTIASSLVCSSRFVRTVAVTSALALATASPFAAEGQTPTPSFTLDLAAAGAQNVGLTVATPSTVAIRILRSGGTAGGGVTLDISEFRSDQGMTAPVLFSVAGGKPVAHLDSVPFDKPVLPVDLHVPAFPTAGKYSGDLILTASNTSGVAQLAVWHFILSSANDIRPATLVINPPGAVTLTAVRRWCFLVPKWNWCTRGDRPVVAVQARDKNGSWPLDGIMMRLEPGLSAPGPGFDPKEHIDGTFDDKKKVDLFAPPAHGERNIGLGGQATISLAFKDLLPGEYTIPLRFTAMNSADDDAQRLTVSLKVSNSIWGAVVVLVLAALLSFLATRIVAELRQRATFLQRLQSMRPTWLVGEPPILPVIWVQAALREAQDLSKAYWISGQSEVNSRLDSVAGILSVLDRMRQVRDQIRTSIHDGPVKRRASAKLDRIVQQIGAGPLADPDVARLKAQLDELATWCDPAHIEQSYWADLQPSITEFCAQLQVADIPNPGQASAQTLLGRIHQAIQQPGDLHAKCAAEEDYHRLRTLWELRGQQPAVLQQLIQLPQWPDTQIQQVYAFIDDFWWEQLVALPANEVTILPPQADFSQRETYSALTFGVWIAQPGLRDSYLVNKKLTWRWTVSVQTKPPWWTFWRQSQTVTLDPESKEPQVAQYSPRPGTINSSVRVSYDGRHRNNPINQQGELAIRKSNDFKIRSLFAYSDLLAFGVALIASVLSGIALYALTPSFGSVKDYLTLFTWGAALDQGKNFVQSLAVYSSSRT